MKKNVLLIGLLIVIVAACAPQSMAPTPPEEMVLTDGLGRQVTLAGPAQRVVSLAPSVSEVLFSLGAGGQVVGRDEFSDYPPEVIDLPSVGGSMGDYNLEAITSLSPDLVLAAEINTPEQVKSMEDLGLRVYYLKNPLTLEDMLAQLVLVGGMLGREDEAAALVANLEERILAARESVAGVTETPAVFYELDGSDPAKPWTAGRGTFIDSLLAEAGGVNIGGVLDGAYAQISQEEILLQDPDIILLGDAAYGVTAEQVAARPGWGSLQAVKSGRIYAFDDNLVSRPGPRLVDGLELLVMLLHPEVELAQ